MKFIKKTRSLCPKCFKVIDAGVFESNGKIYMRKKCPIHGTSNIIIEESACFYKKIISTKRKRKKSTLTINLIHKCNNKCRFCYLPERQKNEIPTREIKKQISNFKGKWIRLSGGEPTLRKDLFEIIEFISKNRKESCLLTNGIKLSNLEYVKNLKRAGLSHVHFSLNSLDKNTLKRIESDILDKKLMALKNLKKTGIKIILSFMFIEGENNSEIASMLEFFLKYPNIIDLRIRSAVCIGRRGKNKKIHTSKLLDIVSKSIHIPKDRLIFDSQIRAENNILFKTSNMLTLPCSFDIILYTENNKTGVFSDGVDINKFKSYRFKNMHLLKHIIKKRKATALKYITYFIKKKPNSRIKRILLRSWPDKHSMDLDNIDFCPTLQLTNDGRRLPFCYALVMNERDNNL